MRAHHQRRLLWIVNAVLGLALVGLGAWFFLDVRGQVADAGYLRPDYAETVLRAYESEPPAAQSALKAPVSEKELDEIDQPRFQKGGKRWWWLYSGPVPPTPPEDAPVETVKRPIVSALEKLGKVLFLIYWPPQEGEEVAAGSVLSWEFQGGKIEEFKPGEPIRASKKDPWSLRLHDIKPAPGGAYEIVYEVFDQATTGDEPAGTSQGLQSLQWTSRKRDPDVEKLIRWPGAGAAAAAAAGEAVAGPAGAASAAGTAPQGPASAEGSVGVTAAVTPEEGAAPSAREEVRATVEWENRTRANVTFDRSTYDYFRDKDPDAIAKTVKTQVARDENGNVLGLAITGLDADSPAMKFDVRRGDIVVSIDGKPVSDRSDIVNIVQGMDENVSRVTVVIDRNGQRITYVIDPRDPEVRRAGRYLDTR